MKIKIGDFEYTEVWDGVFYKKLSDYPRISDWEIRTLIEFIDYEKSHGRECGIECENADLLDKIVREIQNKEKYTAIPRPDLITECTACKRKGCETQYVCHTTSPESAAKILECGKLLSAVKARGVPAKTLADEPRNAARDPEDYFEYVMFSWGNCQAGDRLVMERALGRFPDEEDLSIRFKPGVRFYFKYDKLKNHPGRVFDGVLPMKIKDEVVLRDWVDRIIIPISEKSTLERYIPDELADKAVYLENDCKNIWDWSEKVYKIIEKE